MMMSIKLAIMCGLDYIGTLHINELKCLALPIFLCTLKIYWRFQKKTGMKQRLKEVV